MTRGKDLKRRVRARMQKTGEAYTTARAHLTRRQRPALPPDYEQLAGKSDKIVAEKTGKTWPEWVETLDAIGARHMEHRDIARHVLELIGNGWWSQSVTVGYERIRGLRDVGQRRGGSYEAGKSRTFPVSAETLFDAFADDRVRRRWLDVHLTIRTATPHRTLRITWPDGTDVLVSITAKSEARSTVNITHAKLPSRAAVDQAKAAWAERLDALAKVLETGK